MQNFILHEQLAADTIHIGDLNACRVLLMNERKFPWIILVPRKNDLNELHQLDQQTLLQVQHESIVIAKLMMSLFKGDKLNTGALGNLVPQLHLHHIVRFRDDALWPAPIWGNFKAQPYPQNQLHEHVSQVQKSIINTGEHFRLPSA